jgi:hypothetical protein
MFGSVTAVGPADNRSHELPAVPNFVGAGRTAVTETLAELGSCRISVRSAWSPAIVCDRREETQRPAPLS